MFLRPPGARPEKEFLARCLQCGQCAQVCIFDCIRMRTGFNPFVSGTPEIDPRTVELISQIVLQVLQAKEALPTG